LKNFDVDVRDRRGENVIVEFRNKVKRKYREVLNDLYLNVEEAINHGRIVIPAHF
jgi:hypothetical protein